MEIDDSVFDIEPVRTLYERLEHFRKRRGLSTRKLSELAGVTDSYYAVTTKRLREGQSVKISSEVMQGLAKALNCSVIWLEFGDESGVAREPYELFRIKDDPRPNLARASHAALVVGAVEPDDITVAAGRDPDDPAPSVWFQRFKLAKQERLLR